MLIIIFSVAGVTGYLTTAGALIMAQPWWCNMVGVFMVALMIGVATFFGRMVVEERRRRRVRELRRRMRMPLMLPYIRTSSDR